MTPAQRLGYKVGDKFKVVKKGNHFFSEGSLIELIKDDGSSAPKFKLIEGECGYSNDKSYFWLKGVEPYNESNNYPDFDFKIDLSAMSGSEKEVAKQWLLGAAQSRGIEKGALDDDDLLYWVEKDESNCVCSVYCPDKEFYNEDETPEIFLRFSKPTVESYTCPDKQTKETSEKVLQLQELIGKMSSQLKEAEQKLEEIR